MSVTTFALGDLGLVAVSPMQRDELPLVMDAWQRSSTWRRRQIERVVEAGTVLVARDDNGLALAWLALDAGRVAHGYTKSGYRGNGVMRALWFAAGCPQEHVEDAMRRVRKVLGHLTADRSVE